MDALNGGTQKGEMANLAERCNCEERCAKGGIGGVAAGEGEFVKRGGNPGLTRDTSVEKR